MAITIISTYGEREYVRQRSRAVEVDVELAGGYDEVIWAGCSAEWLSQRFREEIVTE